MNKMYFYRIYGLKITSSLLLPELFISEEHVKADVNVEITRINGNASLIETSFEVLPNTIIFTIKNVARYEVINGQHIFITAFINSEPDQIRLFLLGTALGILLLQRGILPLHGSAVDVQGEAIISVGPSGIGKSTLAATWCKQGYKLLTDDVAAITETNLGPLVHPAYPQQKLWNDSLDMLDIESSGLQKVLNGYEKFRVPIANQFINQSLPLRAVVKIEVGETEEVQFTSLKGAAKLEVLIEQTFRFFLVKEMGLTASHFLQCHSISGQIDVYRFIRPKEGCPPEKMIEIIKNTILKKEVVVI